MWRSLLPVLTRFSPRSLVLLLPSFASTRTARALREAWAFSLKPAFLAASSSDRCTALYYEFKSFSVLEARR